MALSAKAVNWGTGEQLALAELVNKDGDIITTPLICHAAFYYYTPLAGLHEISCHQASGILRCTKVLKYLEFKTMSGGGILIFLFKCKTAHLQEKEKMYFRGPLMQEAKGVETHRHPGCRNFLTVHSKGPP